SRPSGRAVIGIDVTAQNQSPVDPRIVAVAAARPVGAQATGRSPRAPALRLSRGPGSTAVLATLPTGSAQPTASYTLTVSARRRTSGAFLVGYYLPGDEDGN